MTLKQSAVRAPVISTITEDQVVDAENQLIDTDELRSSYFGKNPPSKRTLSNWMERGLIPYFRIGRLIYHDPRLVRAALELNCLVQIQVKKGVRSKRAKAFA